MPKKINVRMFIKRFQMEKRRLPTEIGNMALNHFIGSWRNQGFTGASLQKWAPRKKATRKNMGRALLVQTGHLRMSMAVRSANWRAIRIGSYGIPYAERHNKGLGGMPKRQFVGNSKVLNDKIQRKIKTEIKTIFR